MDRHQGGVSDDLHCTRRCRCGMGEPTMHPNLPSTLSLAVLATALLPGAPARRRQALLGQEVPAGGTDLGYNAAGAGATPLLAPTPSRLTIRSSTRRFQWKKTGYQSVLDGGAYAAFALWLSGHQLAPLSRCRPNQRVGSHPADWDREPKLRRPHAGRGRGTDTHHAGRLSHRLRGCDRR